MQELQARTRNEAILYGLPLLVVFSLLLVSGTLAGKGYQSFNWVLTLTEEDKWLEVIHALGYLVGALVSAAGVFLLSAKKVFFLIWLVLSVLFLGEETSWGQRIFNYEVASVQAHSLQNEFNLHNLYFLNFGGLTSAENWRDVLKAMLDIQFLFQACFFRILLDHTPDQLPVITSSPAGKTVSIHPAHRHAEYRVHVPVCGQLRCCSHG